MSGEVGIGIEEWVAERILTLQDNTNKLGFAFIKSLNWDRQMNVQRVNEVVSAAALIESAAREIRESLIEMKEKVKCQEEKI